MNYNYFLVSLFSISIIYSSKISQNTFLFSIEENELSINNDKRYPTTQYEKINRIINNNEIIKIRKWIINSDEDDIYDQVRIDRIYRGYIKEESIERVNKVINELKDIDIVESASNEIYPTLVYSPNDSKANSQCELDAVGAKSAWDYWDIPNSIPGSENILLASVDTGVDYTHPDLEENIWINENEIPQIVYELGFNPLDNNIIRYSDIRNFLIDNDFDWDSNGIYNLKDIVADGSLFEDGIDSDSNGYIDDLIGWDVGNNDNDPFPDSNNEFWSHGTHVAGALGAITDNGLGTSSISFRSRIIPVKIADSEDSITEGYAGILYAAKASDLFTIINCSWGADGYSNYSYENGIINTAYSTYGASIVCAAGNGEIDDEGNSLGEYYSSFYPAAFPNSLSVAPIRCDGVWGEWGTYHRTIDISAPGEDIWGPIIGSTYQAWRGSSMASPIVASSLALLKSYYEDFDNETLRERILASSDSSLLYDLNPNYLDCNGYDGSKCLGEGIIDIDNAIAYQTFPSINLLDVSVINDSDMDGVPNPGESFDISISIKNNIGSGPAESVKGTLSCSNPDINITNSEVVFGAIPAGMVSNNKIQINTATTIEPSTYSCLLNLEVATISGDIILSDFNIDINISFMQFGFPRIINNKVLATPISIDIDGDNKKEIIFGTKDSNMIYILNSDGTLYDDSLFPFDAGAQIWGSPAIIDYDIDGYYDVIFTTTYSANSPDNKDIYIVGKNGVEEINIMDKRRMLSAPVTTDLDNDGLSDIVFTDYDYSSSAQCKVYAINSTGDSVDGFPIDISGCSRKGISYAITEAGGYIAFGDDAGDLHLYSNSGDMINGFPCLIDNGSKIQSKPAFVYQDGDINIVVHNENGGIYIVDLDGNIVASRLSDSIEIDPMVTKSNHIVAGTKSGMIYIYDASLSILSSIDVNGLSDSPFIELDADNDGYEEIIVIDREGYLYLLNEEGIKDKYFMGTTMGNIPDLSSGITAADIDNDKDPEILFGTDSGIYAFDLKSKHGPFNGHWFTYSGSYNNLGSGYYSGCLIEGSCNYSSNAIIDNGFCYNPDCSGDCSTNFVEDCMGICGGSNSIDCTGTCNGTAVLDSNGECCDELITWYLDPDGDGLGETDNSYLSCLEPYSFSDNIPKSINIGNGYPNPFNPVINFPIALPSSSEISVSIYNIIGQKILKLIDNRSYSTGYHTISWDGSNYGSGIYFIVFYINEEMYSKKVTLIK